MKHYLKIFITSILIISFSTTTLATTKEDIYNVAVMNKNLTTLLIANSLLECGINTVDARIAINDKLKERYDIREDKVKQFNRGINAKLERTLLDSYISGGFMMVFEQTQVDCSTVKLLNKELISL